MSPYLGQILLVGFNFAPIDWNFCDGTTLGIAENSALFTLIGTTYGGDGVNTFKVPDLRGRVTVHQGGGSVIGEIAGTENVSLLTNNLPAHTHAAMSTKNPGTQNNPAGALFGASSQTLVYSNQPPAGTMNAGMVSGVGGNQPHNNVQPFQVCNWIIALYGVFPARN